MKRTPAGAGRRKNGKIANHAAAKRDQRGITTMRVFQ